MTPSQSQPQLEDGAKQVKPPREKKNTLRLVQEWIDDRPMAEVAACCECCCT